MEEKCPAQTPADDNEFLQDLRSRIWFSYRERFPDLQRAVMMRRRIDGSDNHQQQQQNPSFLTTTDCGWGCMVRAAQMLLAQVISQLRLGRDFRLSVSDHAVDRSAAKPANEQLAFIIRLFEDCPHAPLGIHALIEMARRREWLRDAAIERWFSPSQAALLLKDALTVGIDERCSNVDKKLLGNQLRIEVCADNCVVRTEIRELSKQWTVPVLLIVPLRLGTDSVNNIYIKHLCFLFTTETFVGFIGGRTKYASYLIGHNGNLFLLLDPHVVQSYRPLDDEQEEMNADDDDDDDDEDGDHNVLPIPTSANGDFGVVEEKPQPALHTPPREQNNARKKEKEREMSKKNKWHSFHCKYPETVQMDELDPSCALGFLLRTEQEFQRWECELLENGLIESYHHHQVESPAELTQKQQQQIPNCHCSMPLFTVLEQRQQFEFEVEDKNGFDAGNVVREDNNNKDKVHVVVGDDEDDTEFEIL